MLYGEGKKINRKLKWSGNIARELDPCLEDGDGRHPGETGLPGYELSLARQSAVDFQVDVGRCANLDLDKVVDAGRNLGFVGDGVKHGEGASDFRLCCSFQRRDHHLNLGGGHFGGRNATWHDIHAARQGSLSYTARQGSYTARQGFHTGRQGFHTFPREECHTGRQGVYPGRIGITRRQACQGAGGKQTSSFENHGRRRGLVLGEHAGLVETLTAGGM